MMDSNIPGIRLRVLPENNYRAIFVESSGVTTRQAIDNDKPITELLFPEFYDVSINNKCFGACRYCYIEALNTGYNYHDVLGKINKFFGRMSKNNRPFQIALGGAGEATLHPDFPAVLKLFKELSIIPNYTTNGMHLTDDVLEATKKYSGGVAVTCHTHLEKHWRRAIENLSGLGVKLNLHIIISDKSSIESFNRIRDEYAGIVDYFVLLPYMSVGFAKEVPTEWENLISQLESEGDISNVAFGAFFHKLLKKSRITGLSLYEPHDFSKYIDLGKMEIYKSSFHTSTPMGTIDRGDVRRLW